MLKVLIFEELFLKFELMIALQVRGFIRLAAEHNKTESAWLLCRN